MSGEFGGFNYTGYIDTVIKTIADECRYGDREQLTQLFGMFLKHVAKAAEDIAYLEAGDTGVESAARALKLHVPQMIAALDRLHEVAQEIADEGAPS